MDVRDVEEARDNELAIHHCQHSQGLQSWVDTQPALPHYLTTALGQVCLSVDVDPQSLAEVVSLVTRDLRPMGRSAAHLLFDASQEFWEWMWGIQEYMCLGAI